ncbi:MAG TPA: ABC transporter substrate-binding protein, partial [Acetobacteraceae bacterium]|nr:ABC transporter substrate-binding protein [Acetobacteraceae bacterium]
LATLNNAAGRPARTVVIVHEDGFFGAGMAQLMQRGLPGRGFEILETISHPTPARDMSNIALRIRSLNPDLIIPSSYYAEFVLLSRTLQQRRIRPKGIYCVLNGAASNFRFLREFPDAANLVMDVNHWADPRKPKTAELRRQVEAGGRFWLYNTPLNYSAVMLVADALERAGRADRGALIEALARTDGAFTRHIMPYGPTRFENGQNTAAQAVNTQVQEGDIKVIFPTDFADARPVFPWPAT